MNRADRRRRQRTARTAMKGAESVTLVGGPMDGWVVKPDAPALRPDWHEGLIEATAAGLLPSGEWAKLSEPEREPYREQARAKHPPGRYVREGVRAQWQAGLTIAVEAASSV